MALSTPQNPQPPQKQNICKQYKKKKKNRVSPPLVFHLVDHHHFGATGCTYKTKPSSLSLPYKQRTNCSISQGSTLVRDTRQIKKHEPEKWKRIGVRVEAEFITTTTERKQQASGVVTDTIANVPAELVCVIR